MFRRKLRALEFPNWQTFNVEDVKQFRSLVYWLENTKIRCYPVEGRTELRNVDAAEWDAAFKQYLVDVECPCPFGEGEKLAAVLDWLLSAAVGAEYADNADTFNKAKPPQPAAPAKAEIKTLLPDAPTLDCSSPEFMATVARLASALRLPPLKDASIVTALNAIRRRIDDHFSPRAIQDAKKHPKPMDAKAATAMLDALPLGFSTGDKMVDRAAMVIRLLYLADLRDLQSAVNHAMAAAQQHTANPVTDARLGKVGI